MKFDVLNERFVWFNIKIGISKVAREWLYSNILEKNAVSE